MLHYRYLISKVIVFADSSRTSKELVRTTATKSKLNKAPFGLEELKFNSHHINVPSNAWSINVD
jgi:hypothetical protein